MHNHKPYQNTIPETAAGNRVSAAGTEGSNFPASRITYSSEGLPLENEKAFSWESISFEEMASAIFDDVCRMSDFAAVKNRFSQAYLEIIRKLEKGIAELASCCITKTVFEKKGVEFKSLHDLNIGLLYSIVSFNFRKTHAAVCETTIKNQDFWIRMLDMEFRWHGLARRLKATEERIESIRSGKINVDGLVEKICRETGLSFQKDPKQQKAQEKKALPPDRERNRVCRRKSFLLLCLLLFRIFLK